MRVPADAAEPAQRRMDLPIVHELKTQVVEDLRWQWQAGTEIWDSQLRSLEEAAALAGESNNRSAQQ